MPSKIERASPICSKLIGIGDCGTSLISHMIQTGIKDVGLIAVHTDEQILSASGAPTRIHMSGPCTGGQTGCMNPEMDSRAKEEFFGAAAKALEGADMVLIVAHMGDCIDTDMAPVVAGIAKKMEILTIAVVTKPFDEENHCRILQAEKGIAALLAQVDSLAVIPAEQRTGESHREILSSNPREIVDNALYQVAQALLSVLMHTGPICLNFSDVAAVLRNAGMVYIGVGRAVGEHSGATAAKMAISPPLMKTSICATKRLLMNVTAAEHLMLETMESASNAVEQAISPAAYFALGSSYNQVPGDEVCVTVIAAASLGEDTSIAQGGAIGGG